MADMTGSTMDMSARVAELEDRLRQLERRERPLGMMRSALRELLPAEVKDHLRAARKEQLLAARSFLDHWIERMDRPATTDERERISVD